MAEAGSREDDMLNVTILNRWSIACEGSLRQGMSV